jgi:hypothetical protein
MKRILVLLLFCSVTHLAYSQFGSLMNKVKDKVAKKLTGSKTAQDSSATSTRPADQNTDPQTAASQMPPAQSANVQPAAARTPQPPKFPVTGQLVKATTVTFGIDTDEDWANLLKNPMIQDLIGRLRQKGVTGTDKQVLTTAEQHQQEYADIMADMRSKYGNNTAAIKPAPSMVFSVFLSDYDYIFTSDHIRAELGKKDSAAGQSAIAQAMINSIAPGAVTIIDLKNKMSYTVANFLGILPAAIEEDISSYQDAFGLAAYFKKYTHQPSLRLLPLGSKIFHGYKTNVVGMEIPVTPTVDDNGKSSDGLLYLHSLLSGNMADLSMKHYDPSYKLYLETYYSYDLDASIPAAVRSDKNILHVDGFYVGSLLKDEKGNQVVYNIKQVDPNTRLDEGLFSIPDGYEKMTNAEFKQKIKEKLEGH